MAQPFETPTSVFKDLVFINLHMFNLTKRHPILFN